MLAANSEAAVEQLFRRFNDKAVPPVLDWLRTNPNVLLGADWQRVLARYSAAVLRWLSAKPKSAHVFVLTSKVLDPHSKEVQQAGLDVWQGALENSLSITEEDRIQLHSFLLALAFDFSTNQACELIVGE